MTAEERIAQLERQIQHLANGCLGVLRYLEQIERWIEDEGELAVYIPDKQELAAAKQTMQTAFHEIAGR
jgi:hypothetical protein